MNKENEQVDIHSESYFNMIVDEIKKELDSGHCKTIILGSRFIDIQNSDQIKKTWCYKKGRPCKTLYEFCEQEFHLKKTSVAVYIGVTKRFGIYGVGLKKEFSNYIFSQLVEMLCLSDEQLKLVSPDMTVQEIRAIKKAKVKSVQTSEHLQDEPTPDLRKCTLELKNDTQRREFVSLYKSWDVWLEIPQLEQKIYRAMLNNGDYLLVTETRSFERRHDCPPGHFLSLYKKGSNPTFYGYDHYGCSDNEYLSYMKYTKAKVITTFECSTLDEYKEKINKGGIDYEK